MLIFGAKAIPPGLRESGKYVPHNVPLGQGSFWGPIVLDIKPIFYIYHLDQKEVDIPILDWVEQCLHRIVITLNEQFDIVDPDELAEIMCTLEGHIYQVIYCWGNNEIIEL